jgi:hypothetical protein
VTRLVPLVRLSGPNVSEGYDVRLGPLAFVTPANVIGEAIGDGLEAVGAALTTAERKPRPLKLTLPVRGSPLSLDMRQAGLDLRRHLRELIDNAEYRLRGFYFTWSADPEMDSWLLIGTAELQETDPGISFGEYMLELNEVYLVGRPGTHRPGRRAAIADLRTGLAPRDSRRLLYSTDFKEQALPTEPLFLPGDVVGLVRSGNKPVVSTALGPERPGGRHPYRGCAAEDGEALHYLPDPTLLPERGSYIELDELGAVRVWDLSGAYTYPPNPTGYSLERDTDPNIYYGWKRLLGDVLTPTIPLAMDNGLCRVIWLGPVEGLAIEYWDATTNHFLRIGRVLNALNTSEQRVVELTSERGVLEWRVGRYAMRATLQRGWWGPRMEAYDDGGEEARLEYVPEGTGTVTVTPQTPAWVRQLSIATGGHPLLWASGSNDEIVGGEAKVLTPTASAIPFHRTRVLVGRLTTPPGPTAAGLASLSLVDARPVPVLVGN